MAHQTGEAPIQENTRQLRRFARGGYKEQPGDNGRKQGAKRGIECEERCTSAFRKSAARGGAR